MDRLAATVYIFIILGVVAFQFCLVAGDFWGRITQGGRHESVLPVAGRVAAGISVFLLVFMAAGVASEADMITSFPKWVSYSGLVRQ